MYINIDFRTGKRSWIDLPDERITWVREPNKLQMFIDGELAIKFITINPQRDSEGRMYYNNAIGTQVLFDHMPNTDTFEPQELFPDGRFILKVEFPRTALAR